MTREQLDVTLREELDSLRAEITALRTGERPHSTTDPAMPAADPNSKLATKEKTLAYWRRLNEIVLGEATLQQDTESASVPTNAAKVFAIKARISRFAAKAVEAVPTVAVDDAAVQVRSRTGRLV